MSVTDDTVVDGIAVNDNKKTLIMLITDHLDWQKENEYVHLMMLQAKINAYVDFIESKQYTNVYSYSFENFSIEIYFKFGINDICMKFINSVNKQLLGSKIIIIPKDKKEDIIL